jgi:hypothetical protein
MQEDVKVEELEEEGQEIEIEDNNEQESNEVSVETKTKSENDEDLSEYSDSVKKRISKLTNRFREEERQRQAAVDYAEAIKKQNEELKSRIDKLDTTYVGEFDTRVQSQAIAAKEAYKKALEDGNADAMYDAQQNISRIAMEEARLAQLKAAREERAQEAQRQPQQQPQQQVQQQPQQQARAQPDPKAEGWAQKNSWFGQDQTMTYAAFGLHKQLIEDEGFDPNSDEYYTELDTRIRTEFPHKFQDTPRRSNSPRVASAGTTASKSSTPKGRRTVKLTASQIAIARRLNVPLEEYAKYVKE